MKIITYKFTEKNRELSTLIDEIRLGDINLLAGISGVGKTRLLNTIHNLSLMVQKRDSLKVGKWDLTFSINGETYEYLLDLKKDRKRGNIFIERETLIENKRKLIDRYGDKFIFQGKELPKLSKEDIGIYLLREEPVIKKIFSEFEKTYIRRLNPVYYGPIEERISGISKELLTARREKFTLAYIHDNFKDVNSQLYLIKMFHKDTFSEIEADFKEIFPFVEGIDIRPIHEVKGVEVSSLPMDTFIPIIIIKEKKVKKQIPVFQFSSGMMRAIIQLLDIYTMPNHSIYLIDEIENSMGIRSLPVMIDILFKFSKKIQFIFTTHHAYIFNNIDVGYWRILTREGVHIKVAHGDKLKDKFSKSYQEAYIQLLNSDLIENGI